MNNFNFAMPTAIKLTKKDWLKLLAVLVLEAMSAFICFLAGPPIAYIGVAAVTLGFIQCLVMTFIAVNMLIQLDKSGRAGLGAGAFLNALLVAHSINLGIEAFNESSYLFAVFGILSAIFFGSFLVVNLSALLIKFKKTKSSR